MQGIQFNMTHNQVVVGSNPTGPTLPTAPCPALTGIDKGIELSNGRGVKKDGGVSHVRDFHVLPDLTIVAILHALFEGRPGVHLDG